MINLTVVKTKKVLNSYYCVIVLIKFYHIYDFLYFYTRNICLKTERTN